MMVSLRERDNKKPYWTALLLPAILACLLFATGPDAVAQDGEEGQVQLLNGRLELGAQKEVYLLEDLQAGDTLYVTMQATSGNLDPFLAVLDATIDFDAFEDEFQAEVQELLASDEDISLTFTDLRNRNYLGWDDDSGDGYAAALSYPITASGDLYLVAGSALSDMGRATSGDYTLLVGINRPEVLDGEVQVRSDGDIQVSVDGTVLVIADGDAHSTGDTIAVLNRQALDIKAKVSEAFGVLSADSPQARLKLVDIQPGDTLYAFVEATDSSLRPSLILRDFGGKPVEAANLSGQTTTAILDVLLPKESVGYSLEVSGVPGSDGQPITGEFRALVGLNAPEVLTGQAVATERPVLKSPIEVQVGVKIDRITGVDSAGENFTVIGSIRLDWRDPNLAFSPDSCNCDIKRYSDREFDHFLANAASRWPDYTFFNQLGNRSTQDRVAAVWPDGRAHYFEHFTTTFQSDFNFKRFPFDTQQFPIIVDMVLPADIYTLVELPDYSEINPNHGEDEFIVGELMITSEMVPDSALTDRPASRMIFNFEAPRHVNYYMLQVFIPILLIVAISWFTFFLKDYTRRIEASAANILLFIAFSFSLANNYPRLGYVTFLDAIMAVAFIVNALVLLYNVQMKRMETRGEIERVRRIDNVVDWAYPLSYVILIAVVAFYFLGRG